MALIIPAVLQLLLTRITAVAPAWVVGGEFAPTDAIRVGAFARVRRFGFHATILLAYRYG